MLFLNTLQKRILFVLVSLFFLNRDFLSTTPLHHLVMLLVLPAGCLDRGWTTVILQVETNGRIEPLASDDGGLQGRL